MIVGAPRDISDWLGSQINDTFRGWAQGMVNAANWMMLTAIDQLNTGLRINLAAGYLQDMLGVMRYLVLPIIGILLVFQLIRAIIAGKPAQIWTAVTGAAIGVVGGAAAAALAAGVLAIVDQATALILGDAQAAAEQTIAQVFSFDGSIDTVGWMIVIVLAFLTVVAFLAIMAVMVVRKALIIATVVFAPLAFAGAAAERTKAWMWRWAEAVVGLALSKFVIAVIITLGFKAISQWQTGNSSDIAVAVCWVMLAAFAPLAVMRFVSFAGGEIASAHHTRMRDVVGGAAGQARTAVRTTGLGAAAGAGAGWARSGWRKLTPASATASAAGAGGASRSVGGSAAGAAGTGATATTNATGGAGGVQNPSAVSSGSPAMTPSAVGAQAAGGSAPAGGGRRSGPAATVLAPGAAGQTDAQARPALNSYLALAADTGGSRATVHPVRASRDLAMPQGQIDRMLMTAEASGVVGPAGDGGQRRILRVPPAAAAARHAASADGQGSAA